MRVKTGQKLSFKVLVIITLSACFYFYDFILQVSPAVMATPLMDTFKIDATTLGIIISAYYYSYTIFQIPAGILLDLFNVKKVLTLVILVCATGALLFAISNNIYLTALARIMMGAGSAFAFLGALYLCVRWLPTRLFALFVGLVQMIGSLGAASGDAPFAFLINHIGWRHTMLCFAIAGYILAFFVFLIIRDIQNKNPEGLTFNKSIKQIYLNLGQIFSNPQTWFLCLYALTIWAPIATFASLWGVPFLQQALGLSTIQAGAAISAIWIGMAIACPLAGWSSEKIGLRCSILTILALLGLISIILVVYINLLPLWAIYIFLAFIGASAAGQSITFAVIKDIQPSHLISTANGINNMSIVIGGALFQPLVGKLLDLTWQGQLLHNERVYTTHSYHIAFIILPIFYLTAFIIGTFFIRETHCIPVKHLFSLSTNKRGPNT